jgi:hypothetical protein
MYATPASCSIITMPRANGLIGITSLSPVLESVVKLRNRSSTQVRSPFAFTAAVNAMGSMAW